MKALARLNSCGMQIKESKRVEIVELSVETRQTTYCMPMDERNETFSKIEGDSKYLIYEDKNLGHYL